MKVTVLKPREVDVTTARLVLPLRYPGEDLPENDPTLPLARTRHGRHAAALEVVIDVDTGRVRGWPSGRTAKLHMKVVDEGAYFLDDAAGNPVHTVAGDYVPDWVPGKYGDYVTLDIDADGVVANWKPAAVKRYLERDEG